MSHTGSGVRFVRGTRLALLAGAFLAAAALAPPQATSAPAATDSFPNAPDITMFPPYPCIQDPVTIFVRGYRSTPCDSFISASRTGDREIVIRTLSHADRKCAAGPSDFYAVPIWFGTLPAGEQTVTVRRRILSATGGIVLDSTETTSTIGFTVRDACPDPPPQFPLVDLPFVEFADTSPSPPCPYRLTSLEVGGHFNNGCSRVISAYLDGGTVKLVLAPYPEGVIACPQLAPPWFARVPLGYFQAGSYHLSVKMTVQGTNAIWPPIFDASYDGFFDFTAVSQCDTLTPILPYTEYLYVSPEKRSGVICPLQNIRVNIGGKFPDDCFRIRAVQTLPNHDPTPGVPPWIVRVVVDDMGCLGRPCAVNPVPWDTSVVLPGLPAGSYHQIVQLGHVTCSDSIPPDRLYTAQAPFDVDSFGCDSLPSGCLLASFEPGSNGCNAYIGGFGDSTDVTLRVSGGTALSGLQGELQFRQPGLMITKVQAIGAAAGMHLNWTPNGYGAKFVMFAEHGAPIPASSDPVPVLRIQVAPAPIRIVWPMDGFDLELTSLLGADVNGDEVSTCPTFAYAPVLAHICFERPCDFDGNGVADVRDLVRMVHCVNGEGSCPPDPRTSFDCNGDSQFGLADVLCCAVHVLHGPSCPGCSIDSTRDEPTVGATFGTPIKTAQGIDVPLRLLGSSRLGAARVAVRFPGDRFTLASAEIHELAWMELHEASTGQASIGLIRVSSVVPLDNRIGDAVEVILHLALKPGSVVGGDIAVEAGEFSGPDGVMLRVNLSTTPRALDGKPSLAVTSIHPNPSTTAFVISLSLDAPARLDVSVLDLAGRKVATLFHGDQPAGARDFEWEGVASDGTLAPGGVYFLRASIDRQVVVKKLILLNRGSGPAHAMPLHSTHSTH